MSLRIKETTVTASVLLVFKTAWGGRICFFKPATSSFFTAKKKNRVYWDQLQKDCRQKSKEWQITLTLLNLGAGRVTQMCLPTFNPSATPFLKVMLKSCLCASAAELSFDQHYFPSTTVCFSYNLLEEALTIKKNNICSLAATAITAGLCSGFDWIPILLLPSPFWTCHV